MIEKILERLEELFHGAYDTEYVKKDDVLEIVQEVAKEYGNGWIPCISGQMPKDGEDVLVWFEYFRYGEYNRLFQTHGIGYAWNGRWSSLVNGTSGWRDLRIIAWQPLPAPYQKGE